MQLMLVPKRPCVKLNTICLCMLHSTMICSECVGQCPKVYVEETFVPVGPINQPRQYNGHRTKIVSCLHWKLKCVLCDDGLPPFVTHITPTQYKWVIYNVTRAQHQFHVILTFEITRLVLSMPENVICNSAITSIFASSIPVANHT